MTAKCDRKHPLGETLILETAKRNNRPFSFKDFCPPMSHGYFRNCIYRLKGHVIPLPRTCPRFYILKEWRSRYSSFKKVTTHPIGVQVSHCCGSGLESKRVWSSFSSFLESLPLTELVHIHDLHLRFNAADFSFVNSSWKWSGNGCFWWRHYDFDGWGCKVNAYRRTRTCTVSIGCKFFYSTSGLLHLACLLGRVRERLGNVPEPMSWVVTLWHYGKDLKCVVRGRDFEVCFETFSGCLARIYYKHDLAVVRFEEIQTPAKPLVELFEEVLAREEMKGGRKY